MRIPANALHNFINDEALGPIQTTSDTEFAICSPFMSDSKYRCGFFYGEWKKDKTAYEENWWWNDYKARGNLFDGNHYGGAFWSFVKLVKGFATVSEAKHYFLNKYLDADFILSYMTEDDEVQIQKALPPESQVDWPEQFERFDKQRHKPFHKYMQNRLVPELATSQAKIFVDPEQNRVVFPMYEMDELVGYHTRSIEADHPVPWLRSSVKGRFPIWGLERAGDTIIIFEAIFDAIMERNGIALLNSVFQRGQKEKILAKNPYRIVVVMDSDKAGNNRYGIAKELSRVHNNVWIFDWAQFADVTLNGKRVKDYNELVMATEGKLDFYKHIVKWGYDTELYGMLGII